MSLDPRWGSKKQSIAKDMSTEYKLHAKGKMANAYCYSLVLDVSKGPHAKGLVPRVVLLRGGGTTGRWDLVGGP